MVKTSSSSSYHVMSGGRGQEGDSMLAPPQLAPQLVLHPQQGMVVTGAQEEA